VLLSSITIVFYLVRIGPDRLPQQLVRFALTLGLAYALIRGRQWARWLTSALLLLAVVALAPGVLTSAAFDGGRIGRTLVLLTMAALYTAVAGVLIWSPGVAEFFRSEGRTNRPDANRAASASPVSADG
jgi:hypothetical protein